MGIFGSKTVSTTDPRISAFQVTQSSYGAPIPIVFGTTRVQGSMLDYDDFTAIAHTTTTSSGGKSTSVKSSQTSWTYTVAAAIALCEGQCTNVGKIWSGKNVGDLGSNQMTFFDGSIGQSPWGYMLSKHPEKAIGYSGIAYVAGVLDLEDSASMPNYNFEVFGLCQDQQGESEAYISSSTIPNATCSKNAPNETWTIEKLNIPLFPGLTGKYLVVGSISGPTIQFSSIINAEYMASPGEYFNNGKIQFTIPTVGALDSYTIDISSSSPISNSTNLTQQYAYQKTIEVSNWKSNISVQEYVYGQGWVVLDNRYYKIEQKKDSYGNYIDGVYTYTFNFDDRDDGYDRVDPLNIRINYVAIPGSVQYTPKDANPRDIIYQLIANPVFGCQFPVSYIYDWTDFSNYCKTNSLLLSPAITSQQQASDITTNLLEATNSDMVWSQGKAKIVPYFDGLTPIYDITEDNIINQEDNSLVITRNSQADSYNVVPLEFLDRANDYNTDTVYATDQGDIDLHGIRQMSTKSHHEITSKAVAQAVAQSILQKQLYVRNQYVVKLGQEFILLEPMDPVTLACSIIGLDPTNVRVVSVKESKDDYSLEITFEDNPTGAMSAPIYEIQEATRGTVNYNIDPGNVNPPVIFEAPDTLVSSGLGLEAWIGACGGILWGGANVWVSEAEDGNTYKRVGQITNPARQGVLAATLPIGVDPDTVNTLAVDMSLSNSQLQSGTKQDADGLNTLCFVDGELIAYETANLTGVNQYSLSYLRRGAYSSTIKQHNANTQFLRVDDALFKYPFTEDKIGKQIYIKLTSFNVFGGGEQSLADVQPYTYTIQGSAMKSPLPNVQNVSDYYENGDLYITWDPVSDFRSPIAYEIRKGNNQSNATTLGQTFETKFKAPGNGTYYILAVYQGVYSAQAAEIEVTGARIVKNVIATFDEAVTGWPGTLSGAARNNGQDIRLYGAGDMDSVPDVDAIGDIDDYGGIGDGAYEIPESHQIDIGNSALCNVSINYVGYGDSVTEDFDQIADVDLVPDVDGNYSSYVSIKPQINIAGDDGVWKGWQDYYPGQYLGRKFKSRVLLSTTDPTVTTVLRGFEFSVDVPDKTETGVNVDVPVSGASFLYSTPFHALPALNITILNAQQGDDIILTYQGLNGFTCQIVNGGIGVERHINYAAQAY